MAYFCRYEQKRNQQEFPGIRTTQDRTSSVLHGWLGTGSPGKQTLQNPNNTLLSTLHTLTCCPRTRQFTLFHTTVKLVSKTKKELTKSNHGHEKDLHTTAQQQRQQHALARRPKHVSMHQLPTKLLLCILLHIPTPSGTHAYNTILRTTLHVIGSLITRKKNASYVARYRTHYVTTASLR